MLYDKLIVKESINISNTQQQLAQQQSQFDQLFNHSMAMGHFDPDTPVSSHEFKQSMYYRDSLNGLLVEQRSMIKRSKQQLREQQQTLAKNQQSKMSLDKLVAKRQFEAQQTMDKKEQSQLLEAFVQQSYSALTSSNSSY